MYRASPKVSGVLPASIGEGIGRMILICNSLEVYMDWSLWDIHRLFLPPVRLNQYRIFQANGRDIGFITWAKLSPDASDFLETRYFDPRPYEWAGGNRLWLIDMVCESEHTMKAGYWLHRKLFTDSFYVENGLDSSIPAKAIRRSEDKSVRKIANFWKQKAATS